MGLTRRKKQRRALQNSSVERSFNPMQERQLDHDPARVRLRRVAAGLEAQELARRIGISKSALSKIERGRNNASPGVLARLAEVLDCKITDLMPIAPAEGSRREDQSHSQPAA